MWWENIGVTFREGPTSCIVFLSACKKVPLSFILLVTYLHLSCRFTVMFLIPSNIHKTNLTLSVFFHQPVFFSIMTLMHWSGTTCFLNIACIGNSDWRPQGEWESRIHPLKIHHKGCRKIRPCYRQEFNCDVHKCFVDNKSIEKSDG